MLVQALVQAAILALFVGLFGLFMWRMFGGTTKRVSRMEQLFDTQTEQLEGVRAQVAEAVQVLQGAVTPARTSLPLLPTPEGASCKACSYFDLEEGQALIKQYPAFMAAAEHLTPNKMSARRIDPATGEVLAEEDRPTPVFKAKEDRWDLIGLCEKHSRPTGVELRHAVDSCPQYVGRARLPQ